MSYRSWPSSSGAYAPITYVRGVPVDVTLLLVAAHIVCMLAAVVALAFGFTAWIPEVVYNTGIFATGRFWTLLTYPFCHDITMEGIFFALEMLMFFWFGREVERFIGRRAYCWLYAALVVIPPLVMTALIPVLGRTDLGGSRAIHFAVFVGFVMIYPNVQFFFGLIAKWLAWIFLAISSLVFIANHAWDRLAYLWITVGVVWLGLKYAGVGGGFNWLHSLQSWRQQQGEKKAAAHRRRRESEERQMEDSVDAVLEKISKEGMASLTSWERAVLERARQKLVKRDGVSR